jgi:phage antirepressor YoqD-like protein
MPLSQYGGRFGKDLDTPHNEFLNDDGISHKVEGGRKITFKYNKEENGRFKVFASIS